MERERGKGGVRNRNERDTSERMMERRRGRKRMNQREWVNKRGRERQRCSACQNVSRKEERDRDKQVEPDIT